MSFAFIYDYLPAQLKSEDLVVAGLNPGQWIGLATNLVIAIVLGWVLQIIIIAICRIVAKRTEVTWDNDLVDGMPAPLQLLLTLLIFELTLTSLELNIDVELLITSLASCGVIIAITWLLLRSLGIIAKVAENYFSKGEKNTPHARAIHTQVSVLRVVLRFIFIIAAVAMALMQFEAARTLGMSLLTTAGVATFAVGLAARSTIESLFAGIQVAFTQTIKIGDVVVVEGHWGRIETIKLTYVVVNIWDGRRLVVPVSYFTTKPIENWTYNSTQLLGTIYLYTDYSVSLDEIRAELKNTLDGNELWDGRAQGVIVTNLTQTGAEVRLLISAADPSKHWDLRCLVRERMLTWLQNRGAVVYPTHRIESKSEAGNGRAETSIQLPPEVAKDN